MNARICISTALNVLLLSVPVATLAANRPAPTMTIQPKALGPSHTGQPNQSCGSATAPNTPGRAASASGSAFNPSGTAGMVYAGQQPQNSVNSASVSQYDVACSHQR
jgi:hypothetical protein